MSKQALRARALAFACLLSLPLAGGVAVAQTYPARPVNLIVPFPAGGTTDVLARALGQELAKRLGQPVVVENKPGAGSTLGADYVAKAAPDGYTLLMGAVHHTIATSVYKSLHYDFQKDFAPVTTVALVPNVLVVNPKVNAKDVQGLLTLARAAPGKLTYGSNGMGTGQHLIGAQFEHAGQVQLLHVPYKGSGPLTTDLLGGQIDMSFDTITPVLAHIQSGKLRALAVTTNQRSAALPDVPTMEEAGLKPFNMGDLVWRPGAGRRAQRHRHEIERRDGGHHPVAGFLAPHGRDRRRAHRRYVGADAGPHRRRHRELRQAREGGEGGD